MVARMRLIVTLNDHRLSCYTIHTTVVEYQLKLLKMKIILKHIKDSVRTAQ